MDSQGYVLESTIISRVFRAWTVGEHIRYILMLSAIVCISLEADVAVEIGPKINPVASADLQPIFDPYT